MTYDDSNGAIAGSMASGISNKENVVLTLIKAIEESAQGKINDLQSCISEPAEFDTTIEDALVNRTNADATTTELQIAQGVNIRLYQLAPDLETTINAVNPDD